MKQIEDTYGQGVVALGSRGRTFRQTRISTTIFDADVALGGGVPLKFVLAYGPPGGGKSVLMKKTMAGLQLLCRYCREMFLPDEHGENLCECPPECADCKKPYQYTEYQGPPAKEGDPFDWAVIHDEWICECLVNPKGTKAKKDRVPKVTRRATRCRVALFDAENDFDAVFAEALGVDLDHTFVFVPEYAEQGIDITHKLLRSREIDLVGVDSIADLVPSKEIDQSSEEWTIGLQARLVNKAFRMWTAAVNSYGADAPYKPIIFAVNQIRESIRAGETIPGGWGQKYQTSIWIRVLSAQYKQKTIGAESSKRTEILYADMSGFTKRNKTYTALRNYSYRLYLADYEGHPAGSTNEYFVVAKRAIEHGVIARPKDSLYTYEGYTWKSQKAIQEAFRADIRLFLEIRRLALDLAVEAAR